MQNLLFYDMCNARLCASIVCLYFVYFFILLNFFFFFCRRPTLHDCLIFSQPAVIQTTASISHPFLRNATVKQLLFLPTSEEPLSDHAFPPLSLFSTSFPSARPPHISSRCPAYPARQISAGRLTVIRVRCKLKSLQLCSRAIFLAHPTADETSITGVCSVPVVLAV